MRAFNESQSHTDQAQEYKKEQNAALVKELDTRLSEYAKSLSSDQKNHIKSNITGHMDAKIAEMERAYLAMRSKRGEKITIQDMDDIMPYLKLAMLRDLHTYIADRGSEGANALKAEITALEGEIASAKTKIEGLMRELDKASGRTEKAFKSLLSSPEYDKLRTTQNALGKNAGALEAWKAAEKLVTDNITPADILSAFNILYDQYETDAENCNKVKSKISGIELTSGINGGITKESARVTVEEITTLLGEIRNDPNFSDYEPILIGFKSALEAVRDSDPSTLPAALNALNTYITINKPSYDVTLGELETQTTARKDEADAFKATITNVPLKIEEVKTAIASNIQILSKATNGLTTNAGKAKVAFEKKLNAIKTPIKKQTEKAQELGRTQGVEAVLSKTKKEKEKKAGKYDVDTGKSEQQTGIIDTEKKSTDASQKIRINAQNLIVRSGPEKKAKPLLTDDKKKAIMLKPGDSVTPILVDGNVETKEDGPREYTHVKLDDGTEGWIALSDKIGSKWKQEYGDVSMGNEVTYGEYQLKGDNVRLRSGANTNAEILDVLDAKKVKAIQKVGYSDNNAAEVVEGSGKVWYPVEITYSNDKKRRGYIAGDFLQNKSSSAKEAQDALRNL